MKSLYSELDPFSKKEKIKALFKFHKNLIKTVAMIIQIAKELIQNLE